MHEIDQAVHAGLRARDPSALDRLIAELTGPVVHLAGLILGQAGRPEDAEEVAADVFAQAWQRIGEYDPARATLRTWVLMLTKFRALLRRRQLLRQRYTAGGEAKVIPLRPALEPTDERSPEDQALRTERRQRLHQALARLPDADRELLIRRYFLEEPIPELARAAGLSRSAIDNRLWRARQALKAVLGTDGEVDGLGDAL